MLILDPTRLAKRVFPILSWSRNYDLRTGIGDLIAGITVALTLIPQSIAYASLAGFKPQYGLYSSFVGGFVYALMGACPQINIGPTALLSLLTFTYTNGTNPDYAVLLCFISGIVQIIAGIIQLGFLVEFVSLPVVSGFTSAAAVTIASSQLKGLLGLRYNADTFMSTWRGLFHNIGGTRIYDALLGFGCCILLMGMKELSNLRMKSGRDVKGHGNGVILQRILWLSAVSRNAFVVVIATLIAFFLHEDKNNPLILTGDITPGLPRPRLPPFQSTIGNETVSAAEMISHLGSGLLVVPLVGIISNVAIAKAFSGGKTLDASQEMVALGACNIISAFFSSYPVNGAFSRSAVSNASGVKTPLTGVYTGVIVLLTLGILTPYFYFIPRAALSAVIVCAVLSMVDVDILKKLWITNRLDLIPLVGTFVCCLALGIEIGLACGVITDVLLLLYYQARPPFVVRFINDGSSPPYFDIHPIGGLHFASAERIRSKLISLKNSQYSVKLENLTIIQDELVANGSLQSIKMVNILVIHCDALSRLDYTFLQGMKMLVKEWSDGGLVIWCNASPAIKDQLSAVLQDPLFCDIDRLRVMLLDLTMTTQVHSGGDTRL